MYRICIHNRNHISNNLVVTWIFNSNSWRREKDNFFHLIHKQQHWCVGRSLSNVLVTSSKCLYAFIYGSISVTVSVCCIHVWCVYICFMFVYWPYFCMRSFFCFAHNQFLYSAWVFILLLLQWIIIAAATAGWFIYVFNKIYKIKIQKNKTVEFKARSRLTYFQNIYDIDVASHTNTILSSLSSICNIFFIFSCFKSFVCFFFFWFFHSEI